MSSVILETQKAVYAKLTGDATLMGMVKGVYDHVPDGAEYPYVTIGDFLANNESTKSKRGYMLDLNINVYSQAVGRKNVLEIMERVRVLLDEAELVISGFEHIYFKLLSQSTTVFKDKNTIGGRTFFRVKIYGY